MSRPSLLLWGALVALLGLLACHRAKYAVVTTEVSASLWPQELGVATEADLRRIFDQQLAKVPALHAVADKDKVAEKTPRYEIAFTPTLVGSPQQGGEVIAALLLRRTLDDLSARYPVEAEVPFDAGSTPARVQAALVQATARAMDAATLQISALESSPSELRSELTSRDPRVRAFALGRLAELRDPSAGPALRKALKSDDLDEVRHAVGGLVAIGDQGAVPAIIEAAEHRPPELQREIIYALGELGGAEAQGFLYTMSEGADLEPIRAAAHEALQELEARHDATATAAAHPKETSR